MNDYVSKPIDLDMLLAAIARQAPGAAVAVPAGKVEVEAGAPSASDTAALDELNSELDDLLAGLGAFTDRKSDAA